MNINIELNRKPEDYKLDNCVIDFVEEIDHEQFESFQNYPTARYGVITDCLHQLPEDTRDERHCSRLDYGKKRCHDSPTMGEEDLHRAIMRAVQTVAMQNTKLLQTLKSHIAMTVKCDDLEDQRLEIKVRLAEINEEFQKAMSLVSVDDDNNVIIEQRPTELIMERDMLNKELAKYAENDIASAQSKINDIVRLTDILENQPMQFNDELVRQMLQCVVVENKDQIKVIFNDGTEIDQPIQNC